MNMELLCIILEETIPEMHCIKRVYLNKNYYCKIHLVIQKENFEHRFLLKST